MPTQPKVRLRATLAAEPMAAMEALQRAAAEAGVDLLDARRFGGSSLVLTWEMERDDRDAWMSALAGRGVALDEDSRRALSEASRPPFAGTLQVTLVHDGPDVTMPVPAVPG